MYRGHRLSFEGALCTVRFVGEVQGTKGVWYGVEWDDPTRGKHDGTHEGVRYFTCVSKYPSAASFIRPSRPADPRRTFLQALSRKYVEGETAGHTNNAAAFFDGKKLRINGKEVEEVGFDKIRARLADLRHLRVVLLEGMCIGDVVGKGEDKPKRETDSIEDSCPEITELDLGRNLFEEWREVVNIAEKLEKLRSLRAGGNRFRDISLKESERLRLRSVFKLLKSVNLDFTLLIWKEICDILSIFTTVATVKLSSNALTTLENHVLPTSITTLDLQDNHMLQLADMTSLTQLPKLQTLNLKMNNIQRIQSARKSNTPDSPPLVFSVTLTTLDLSYNAIDSWSFIDSLPAVFPGLTSLRIAHNPLYQTLSHPDGHPLSPDDGYSLTIARLAALTMLNFSAITPKDRLDAEAYYLSLVATEITHAGSADAKADILAKNPRYAALSAQHGVPAIPAVPESSTTNTLAANFISITFNVSSKDATIANKITKKTMSFTKEIPRSFSVYAVLGIVGKHLDIFPLNLQLTWETGDWVYASNKAGGYGIYDGNIGDDDDDGVWDSEDEVDEATGEAISDAQKVPREVEIAHGTRAIGTWIDGSKAVVRVEYQAKFPDS